jgi:hypothetical protein
LRPLCVSALDNSRESKKQLGSSINYIDDMLSKRDEKTLRNQIDELGVKRLKLKNELKELRKKLFNAIRSEYKEIIIGQKNISPSEAGRHLANEISDNWIPGITNQDTPPIIDSDFLLIIKKLLLQWLVIAQFLQKR